MDIFKMSKITLLNKKLYKKIKKTYYLGICSDKKYKKSIKMNKI